MASFLNKARHSRCYFCHRIGASEASYRDICIRHQLLISLRLFVLVARRMRFRRMGSIVRWWR
jgi:hypothetical protein